MVTTRTCFLLVTIQLLYAVSAQEIDKRIPQGFVGMRGKKHESLEQFYKRKPQFFVGVKGKKSIFDLLEAEEKRAPMGFVGMRGKKEAFLPEWNYENTYEYNPKREAGSLIGQIDFSSSELNNFNSHDFPILNQILNDYLQKVAGSDSLDAATDVPDITNELTNERITNEVDKRAANFHQFYGVRGKKSIYDKRPYDLNFRGKFIGVRGKKDLKNSGAQEIRFLLSPNGPWPKRKAQMGFVGMRGKKWTDDLSLETEIPN